MPPSDTRKKKQLDKFKEPVREVGTDDDEKRFNEKMSKGGKASDDI